MVGRVYRVRRDRHSLGGLGTAPLCFTVHFQLPMDRTTSRLLHSRFAGCPRHLGRIPGIGTRISMAHSVGEVVSKGREPHMDGPTGSGTDIGRPASGAPDA